MSTTATEVNEKRVITPIARLSYPYLFKPAKPVQEGGVAKFQCELIFESGTDLSELKRAANKALRDKFGDKPPKNIKSPFRSGSDRDGKDGYEDDGVIFIGARTDSQPGVVVGKDRKPCTDPTAVYGGCYVKASVTAFAYETNGNRGVSFALNNVWKIRDGEPFGSARNAEQEFEGCEIDENDFDGDSFGSSVADDDSPF